MFDDSKYRSMTKISLPDSEYLFLLGISVSVFSSNVGFIIENLGYTSEPMTWYKLTDLEAGRLRPKVKKYIAENFNEEIYDLYKSIVERRNRIIHGFRITSKENKQVLATKTKDKDNNKDGNKQFEITIEYLVEFIELNSKLSKLLDEFRETILLQKRTMS